jgi:hypothetical protein
MLDNKHKKASADATAASVQKEMAKPRITKSARIAELNLDTFRIPEQPSTTMLGTVNKIIPSPFRASPKRHKSLSKVPTTGMETSVLKIR